MAATGSDSDGRALGADVAAEILAHHGVKGMKWGVRKAEKAQARATKAQNRANSAKMKWDTARAKKGLDPKEVRKARPFLVTRTQREATAINTQHRANILQKRADKKLKKIDGKWEHQIYSMTGMVDVHNAMADHFNSRIGAINDRHPNAHIDHPDTPATKAYMKDILKAENEGYALAVKSVHGESPSGKKEAIFINDADGQRIEVRDKTVQHAEDTEPDVVMHVNVENGKIVSGNKAALEHSDMSDSDSLAHYGVKGMKWGVRKSEGSGPTAATAIQKRPGAKVKAKGGEGHPASEDAKRAAENVRKAKKSRPDALSNAELQDAIKRMQLEQQFAQLSKGRQNAGRKFVQRLLGDTASQQVSSVVNTQASAEIDKQLRKHGRPVAAKSKYKD